MSKRLVKIAVLATVIAAGLSAGGAAWWGQRGHVSTDNAYVRGDVTPISPKVTGYVTEVAVTDNQAVTAGQILARIDDRDHRARLAEAEAAVAAARAALDGYDRRIDAQRAEIAEAAAGLATWRAELDLAGKELTRTASLARQDFASRQRLDSAEAAVTKARAGLAQADASLTTARSQIAVLEADRARQRALLDQATAHRELAQVDLENTVVRAPVDGVVGNRGVRLGQLVSPGAHLLSLVPLEGVWVEANFKETQIGTLRPGQPVRVRVDAFPDAEITGTVGGLAPASGAEFSLLPPENATGNFTKIVQRVPVRIELPAGSPLAGQLRPGLSVVVDIDTTGAGGPGAAPAGGALAKAD
ncbi:HlyD family secretion protein [Novispirillum sp. DQ9]|uniref:HlyD family secretion protein n=1 Tax=Novispirillum sp. DQ9 TaxID=3398612 RepID=UPI003C7C2FD8